MQLVYVEWEDHTIDSGWTHHNDVRLEPRCVCKSVGWVVTEDHYTLCLAPTIRQDKDESAMRQYIVKAAILHRWPIPDGTLFEENWRAKHRGPDQER